MKAKVKIEAGICLFNTMINAVSTDGQHVELDINSECQTIIELSEKLKEQPVINAMADLGPAENKILSAARSLLVSKGCCEACVVPIGICKAMQVAAGLALPRDVVIQIIKEK